ncbi:MAG: exodeoxyribonuclease VII large subunit [Candidatus Nanopelagicales bacterium]|nr:exodeoxyribonuclease VII large subunit [Candidatus Nanopelagicales bacterium]MCU0295526.1 exodeoxyribonuclease VII large subunit [Candidatus Nanopelagicales bacterium]
MSAPTAEQPWPLRVMLTHFRDWVGRLGQVWVAGEISKVRAAGGQTYLTLRDEQGAVSADVMIHPSRFAELPRTPAQGDRVVLLVKAQVTKQTRILLRASHIHLSGLGDLLAQIEQRRRMLAQEGLFAEHRKRSRPLIPRRVGVVTGRDSDALKDVRRIATARFPGVRLEVREVAVQGRAAVPEITAALLDLDENAEVDVIIVTRGGGSLEDLLPFSDEGLVRTVAAMRTPVISAIGHEADRPILDDVADARAATPTHAATLAVPDVAEVLQHVQTLRRRMRTRVSSRVEHERHRLDASCQRRVLRDPRTLIDLPRERLEITHQRLLPAVERLVERQRVEASGLDLQLRALSPQATLDRGYALVTDSSGALVRTPPAAGTRVHVRVQAGRFDAAVEGSERE